MSTKKPMTKGKIFRLVAVGLITMLLTVYIGIKTPYVQNKIKKSYDVALAEAAEAANKDCPRMTDAITRLDSVSSLGGLTLAYHYTITQANVQHADTIYVRTVMTPQVISSLKTSKKMQQFAEMGCTILINYADSNGKHMLTIPAAPQQYLLQEGELF